MNLIKKNELLDPRAVWIFQGVATAGGFRKGALRLGLTQPAVSAAIARLEGELGLELFVREGNRKVLSPAGQELLAVSGVALNDWAGLEERVREGLEGRPRGRLRVGAGESSLLYLLPPAVAAFRRAHPDVELVLQSQPYEESLQMLRNGSLDIAFRSLSRPAPGISWLPLRSVRRVFIASASLGPKLAKRPTIAQLRQLPFVVPHRESTTRAALGAVLARAGLSLRVALEAGSWEAVKLYVAQGIGVGLVPEIVVTPSDRRRLTAVPAGHLVGAESYGVLRATNRPLTRAAQAMLETLQAHSSARS